MLSEGNVVLICTHDRGTLVGRGRRFLPTRLAPKIEVVSKRTRNSSREQRCELTGASCNHLAALLRRRFTSVLRYREWEEEYLIIEMP